MRKTVECLISVVCAFSVLTTSLAGAETVIYVDHDAPLAGDGVSWQTAYRFLQDALSESKDADKPIEIRVAHGTYKPDQGSGQTAEDRLASFRLVNGAVLKGGYAGVGTPDPNARDIELYETILSGDLAGDDVLSKPLNFVFDPNKHGFWGHGNIWDILVESTRLENSTHVVVTSGVDQTAVLEGFTLSGGNAYHPPYMPRDLAIFNDENDLGGAIFNNGGSPTVRSCRFVANSAIGGGAAVYNKGPCSPTILDCRFLENFSWSRGAVYNDFKVDVVMEDCVFERNVGAGAGIVMFSGIQCRYEIIDCRFSHNGNNEYYADSAVYIGEGTDGFFVHCEFESNRVTAVGNRGNMLYQDCKFIGNSGHAGGGVGHLDGTTRLNRCVFVFNRALWDGGGIYIQHYGGNVDVTNCLFYGNRVERRGGAVLCENNSRVVIENSIFWNNQSAIGPDEITLEGDSLPASRVSYSLIDGGQAGISTDSNGILIWGSGNISDDPLFADPGYWNPNGTLDDSSDDFFVVGDYHLKSQAGRWDTATQTWVLDDITGPCIDAGDPITPIRNEPFPNGGLANMGVYGGTAEASKSYFGEPICETIIAGDINGDCRVDFLDLAILTSHWLEEGHPEYPYGYPRGRPNGGR